MKKRNYWLTWLAPIFIAMIFFEHLREFMKDAWNVIVDAAKGEL
jgi:hypothetical protein